ncbi:MAG: serine hydrolase domain-containing protein [Myxococcota bacterium]
MRALCSLLLLASCAASSAPAPSGDHNLTTASGATLEIPDGWSLRAAGEAKVLEDPQQLLRVTLVERPEADLLRAIDAAWGLARPGATLMLKGEPDAPPPDGGWDSQLWEEFEAPAGQRLVLQAWARRFGDISYVALIEGDEATLGKRQAQLDTSLGSLRPPGMRDESLAGQPPRPLDPAALEAFISSALAALEVPGAAVAVISKDRVIYEHSWGVRALGSAEPITPETLFLLASITKPMTTLMEATLVDAGLFSWGTPVTQLLPSFALGDPELTRKVELWHMSCACTGMPRQDLEDLFEYGNYTPEARLASMKDMKPTTALGETFQYSNLMVAAGGFAAAHAYAPDLPLGAAFAKAMREKLFQPIGMRSTTLDLAVVQKSEHASPHALSIDGQPRPMPLEIEAAVLPIAPAGAVWTNLHDMERYVITELQEGLAPGGARVVSPENLRARRTMRVRSSEKGGYGLGLDVGDYHGLLALSHDGGAFGFGTSMLMFPEEGLGFLVLTNVRNGGGYQQLPFNAVVLRKMVELLFQSAKPRATIELSYDQKARRQASAQAIRGLERTPEAAWLSRLSGTYTHPTLGTVTIQGDRFDAGEWQTRFGRRVEGGVTNLVFLDPPFAGSGPRVEEEGGKLRLVIDYGEGRYAFERR